MDEPNYTSGDDYVDEENNVDDEEYQSGSSSDEELGLSSLCYKGYFHAQTAQLSKEGYYHAQTAQPPFTRSIPICISAFPDLLSGMRKEAYKENMPTEARNFLLENSPNATFIMDLPEAPTTKEMRKEAREKRMAMLVADVEGYMKELQASLDLKRRKLRNISSSSQTLRTLWQDYASLV